MSRSNLTIRFVGTLNITHDIDPTLPNTEIIQQAKLLIAKGEFSPTHLTLEVVDLDSTCKTINGTKFWRNEKGQLHRTDGPAVETPNGSQYWYQYGLYHRENGPAIIHDHGTQIWYLNGQLHRTDGPALINQGNMKFWFLNGKPLSEQQWKEQVDLSIDPPTEINKSGTKIWKNEKGQLHRDNGPTAIYLDGSQEWCQNGRYHRTDGPAIIHSNGSQFWCKNGQYHRTDGPAIIRQDGSRYFYLNDQRLSEKEWKEQVKSL